MQRLITGILILFLAVHITAPAKHVFSLEEANTFVEPFNIFHIIKSSAGLRINTPKHSVISNAAGRCCSHRHLLIKQSVLPEASEIEAQPLVLLGTGDLPRTSLISETSFPARRTRGVLKNPSIRQLSAAMLRTTILLI